MRAETAATKVRENFMFVVVCYVGYMWRNEILKKGRDEVSGRLPGKAKECMTAMCSISVMKVSVRLSAWLSVYVCEPLKNENREVVGDRGSIYTEQYFFSKMTPSARHTHTHPHVYV